MKQASIRAKSSLEALKSLQFTYDKLVADFEKTEKLLLDLGEEELDKIANEDTDQGLAICPMVRFTLLLI